MRIWMEGGKAKEYGQKSKEENVRQGEIWKKGRKRNRKKVILRKSKAPRQTGRQVRGR